jgi:DNA-binding CsgD family transcriptional regulator
MEQVVAEVIDPNKLLTKKGRVYLKYAAEGKTVEEMAAIEHRSLATAKSNMAAVKRDLNAGNGPSLIAIAVAKGILRISLVKAVAAFFSFTVIFSAVTGNSQEARVASQRIRNKPETEMVG